MITYRRYKNTDPPALVEVWNESLNARGSYPVRTPALFERWIFSKPYFRHDALCVAWDWAAQKRLHPAFLWGGLVVVASQPVRLLVSGTGAWMAFAAWATR